MKAIARGAAALVVLVVVMATASAQHIIPAADQNWTVYTNSRFGVQAEIPETGFTRQPPPANGDGIMLLDASGTVDIRVYGNFGLAMNTSFTDYRGTQVQYLKQDGAKITYESSGDNWFVLSGHIDGDRFYRKAITGDACAIAGHISIQYPAKLQGELGPIIAHVEDSLRFAEGTECS